MSKKNTQKYRFIIRLKKTKKIFGYVSLDSIVNSHLKYHLKYKVMKLKRIYDINQDTKKPKMITKQFREMQQKKLKRKNIH